MKAHRDNTRLLILATTILLTVPFDLSAGGLVTPVDPGVVAADAMEIIGEPDSTWDMSSLSTIDGLAEAMLAPTTSQVRIEATLAAFESLRVEDLSAVASAMRRKSALRDAAAGEGVPSSFDLQLQDRMTDDINRMALLEYGAPLQSLPEAAREEIVDQVVGTPSAVPPCALQAFGTSLKYEFTLTPRSTLSIFEVRKAADIVCNWMMYFQHNASGLMPVSARAHALIGLHGNRLEAQRMGDTTTLYIKRALAVSLGFTPISLCAELRIKKQ